MLGKQDKPSLTVKAGEARGLLDFVEPLLESCRDCFVGELAAEGTLLLEAVKSLNKFDGLLQANKDSRRVSDDLQQQLFQHYHRFVTLVHRIDTFSFSPKLSSFTTSLAFVVQAYHEQL